MQKGKCLLWVFLSLSFLLTAAPPVDAAGPVEDGKTVRMHYTLKVGEEVVETTRDREPFQFVCGKDLILPGLEKGVKGHEVGDRFELTLSAEEGYGVPKPEKVVSVPKANFKADKIEVGMTFVTDTAEGAPIRATVKEVGDESVVLDFNHPLAGKEVHFDIEILAVA